MSIDDLEQRFVWKSLFVIAELGGRVYAGQDRGLARSTLRASFDAETRICWHDDSIEKRLGSFVLENCEGRGVVQVVERIEWTSCADSQAVDEEEKYRSVSSSS